MKFMMLMIPAVYQGEEGPAPDFVPDPEKVRQMTQFNEEMGRALKLLDLNGLHPQATGARVAFRNGQTSVTDGPFIESKEVLGGYWLVEADSKEEMVEWATKCPADDGDVIELRQIFGPEDFKAAK
jgi:hypothetical protein